MRTLKISLKTGSGSLSLLINLSYSSPGLNWMAELGWAMIGQSSVKPSQKLLNPILLITSSLFHLTDILILTFGIIGELGRPIMPYPLISFTILRILAEVVGGLRFG